MKATFAVDISTLKALQVFSGADHYTMAGIHARAKDGTLMLESTDAHALLRVYPTVEIDGDQTFDALLPVTGFDVLKAKLPKHATKTATLALDGGNLTLTYGGLSSTSALLDVTAYPTTDTIADSKPTNEPVEAHSIAVKLLADLTKCLSCLGATALNFTANHGEFGRRAARGTANGTPYEVYFMPRRP
jgi:hypothetical protein